MLTFIYDFFLASIQTNDVQDFKIFHSSLQSTLNKRVSVILEVTEVMTPCMVKIEELLFASRTRRAPQMQSYYDFWEEELYKAVVTMVLSNLDDYLKVIL